MSFIEKKVLQRVSHFQQLERILALTLISIPAILWVVEGELKGSISAYVRMGNSYVFGSLLTIAAMLYIFTGILYYKDVNHQYKGQLYNFVLGFLLLGVVFVPHDKSLNLWHFVCAIGFFLGNALIIVFKSPKEDKRANRIFGLNMIFGLIVILSYVVYFALLLLYPNNGFTLFWAEWISLTAIAVLLESLGHVSFTKQQKS